MNDFSLKLKQFLLVIGDVAVFYLSLLLALWLRHGLVLKPVIWQSHWLPYSIIYLIWLVIFYINGLYELRRAKNHRDFYRLLIKAFIINAVIALAFFYFTPQVNIAPKTVLFLNLGIGLILLMSWRRLFNYLIQLKPILNNLAIIGDGPAISALAEEIEHTPQLGYQLYQYRPIEEVMANPENFKQFCLINKIQTIVYSNNLQKTNTAMISSLYQCLPLGIEFYDYPTFYEKIAGKIPIDTIGQIWFLENLKERDKKIYDVAKRVTDFILALIFGLFALPFSPFIALLIKLDSRGPAVFKQIRIGKNGKPFQAMKFRTMTESAEVNGPQWAQQNDPRITRIGKWLRKLRIDEIPQLINILRNEMSFIGPRPERPEFIELLEQKIPFYQERLLIKPGLTGWAQVMGPAYGGSEKETFDKLQYDLYYIKNRNLLLDLSIILKTIKTVLKGVGQ